MKTGNLISARMWKGARELYPTCKKRVQELAIENEELKSINSALKKKLNL